MTTKRDQKQNEVIADVQKYEETVESINETRNLKISDRMQRVEISRKQKEIDAELYKINIELHKELLREEENRKTLKEH